MHPATMCFAGTIQAVDPKENHITVVRKKLDVEKMRGYQWLKQDEDSIVIPDELTDTDRSNHMRIGLPERIKLIVNSWLQQQRVPLVVRQVS